jgi:hypothetical protein
MAYETNSFSSISDVMTKLSTFAVANGWTEDHVEANQLFLTKSTVSVSFCWATSSPTVVGIFQQLAFLNASTDPGSHTDDSGNGSFSTTDTTVDNERHVIIPDTGGTYWFFEQDTYLHIVIERGAGTQSFSHFGFGILNKEGTWTGGEYCYGMLRTGTTGTSALASSANYSFGLDALAAGTTPDSHCATMHMEGMPNQAGSGKWGLVWGGGTATLTDTAAVARANVSGGFRGGPIARAYGRFGGSPIDGLIPMYPIGTWYDDPSNARWYYLGSQPDVRGVSIESFTGGQEVVIGSDTWVMFPVRYKTATGASGGTRNLGIAYKKDVT